MRTIAIAFAVAGLGCAGDAPTSNPSVDAAPTADAAPEIDAAPKTQFSFFVTSTSGPDGGNFGGLAGADEFCRTKAVAALPAASTRTWKAYLSATGINARDRIGTGPWFNKNGVMVATDLTNLHDPAANVFNKTNSVDETGATVNGTGDTPNQHDIITGSDANGMATANTCADWTSAAATGVTASVGHHDRNGGSSWNAAHNSNGCSAAAFVATGGRGSIYCFAAD